MNKNNNLRHQDVMNQCEIALRQGRLCQLKLTYSVVQSEAFQSWILKLYQQYPASQLRQQLRLIDQGDPQIRQVLDKLLPTAALTQLKKT